MAEVRTLQVLYYAGISGLPLYGYTVPDGKRLVIECVNWTTGLNLPLTWATLGAGPIDIRFAGVSYPEGTADWTSPLLVGKWVFDAGTEIAGTTDGSTWDCIVSGYLLDLP